MHDLLLAKGGIALPQSHGLRASVERHKGRLTSELTLARLRRKAPSLEVLREQVERDTAGEEAHYPRWVRINALNSTMAEQLESTFSKYTRVRSIQDLVTKPGRNLLIDPHVPNLVAVTPGTDLTKTDAYAAGKIILQDKSSCFPAYLLDPHGEDGDVVDSCAAPGNKTTHVAAVVHEHRAEFANPPQTIFAFEKDPRRAQTLEQMVKVAGAKKMTRVGFGQDFLQVDPRSDRFRSVGALLLDPSCSGSGIVGRDSMPELHLPTAPEKAPAKQATTTNRKRKFAEDKTDEQKVIRDDDGNETVLDREKDFTARLEALAAFQLELLLHAFTFPAATKVTYSTCSVHVQENEQVVMRALQSDVARTRGWRVLAREEQVSGMRDWEVRGVADACGGDGEIADGCIRSYKDDGRGVMGFFVVGFQRRGSSADFPAGSMEDGPFARDGSGMMIRDDAGMPVLKSTGQPVSMNDRDEGEGIEEEEEDMDGAEDSDSDSDSSHGSSSSAGESAKRGQDEDEWQGLGDY